jgi:MerR family mercuric resistance operon transcriptional regulator
MPGEIGIGRLAKSAGVGVETIRFYQREGLIAVPPKPPGGQRRYAPETALRIGFVKQAQRLGFSLAEVKSLLLLEDGQSCRETRALAQRKLEAIRARIADLQRMRRTLAGLIAECESGKRPRRCPIIGSLSRQVPPRLGA